MLDISNKFSTFLFDSLTFNRNQFLQASVEASDKRVGINEKKCAGNLNPRHTIQLSNKFI